MPDALDRAFYEFKYRVAEDQQLLWQMLFSLRDIEASIKRSNLAFEQSMKLLKRVETHFPAPSKQDLGAP